MLRIGSRRSHSRRPQRGGELRPSASGGAPDGGPAHVYNLRRPALVPNLTRVSDCLGPCGFKQLVDGHDFELWSGDRLAKHLSFSREAGGGL